MNFLKAAIPTAFELILRSATTIALLKIVAVYGGSDSVTLLGQFQNFFLLCGLLGGGLLANGVISISSLVSREGRNSLVSFWNFVLSITLVLSITVVFVLILGSSTISAWFFDHKVAPSIVTIVAILLVPFCLQTTFLAMLNGIEKPSLLAISRTMGSLFLVISFLLFLYFKGVEYSFIAIILGPAIAMIISYVLLVKHGFYRPGEFRFKISDPHVKRMLHYGAMAAVSTASLPLLQIYVRTYGISLHGAEQIGQWDGVFRLFDQFLALITSVFAVYFLPRLAKSSEIQKTTYGMLIFALCSVLVLALTFSGLQQILIPLFLSNKFLIPREWVLLIALAGVFKIAGWVFSYALIARGKVKYYITAESLFFILGVCIYYLVAPRGPQMLIIAFLGAYIFYFVFCFIFFKRMLKQIAKSNDIVEVT